jgi:uncharacterized protein
MSHEFKPLETGHKDLFRRYLNDDPPQVSELTFTNLFIWQHCYHPVWLELDECLLIILSPDKSTPFGLQPFGKGYKEKALDALCSELRNITDDVRLCRVSEDFINRHIDPDQYFYQLDRNNSDYVYTSSDLIELSGRRYHSKKNHLNAFIKNYKFEYLALDKELVGHFMDMQEEWCRIRDCLQTPDLLLEDYAVKTALTYFDELDYKGAAIRIGSKIEAFSLGEQLNSDTAVIHIEKANPDIPGLYNAINHFFVRNAWSGMEYVNREQDLGLEGLRKAKESYYPHHMVNKYTVFPR